MNVCKRAGERARVSYAFDRNCSFDTLPMADLSLKLDRVALNEASDDEEEVPLMTAAVKPAVAPVKKGPSASAAPKTTFTHATTVPADSDEEEEEVALVIPAVKPTVKPIVTPVKTTSTSKPATAAVPADSDEDDPSMEVKLTLDSADKDKGGADGEADSSGIMVLALLDKIIGVVDQIQQTQDSLESRQTDMERSVSSIHGELTKLAKSHAGTSSTVNKMLGKLRKVNTNVKSVRGELDKQAGQIKKLESNESELLRRKNFKVMIYQVRHGTVCVCVSVRWIEVIEV